MANAFGTKTASRLRETFDPGRRAKRFTVAPVETFLARLAQMEGSEQAARARQLKHPLTGLPLLSVAVDPP